MHTRAAGRVAGGGVNLSKQMSAVCVRLSRLSGGRLQIQGAILNVASNTCAAPVSNLADTQGPGAQQSGRQETNFHSFNNQTGVWVELIALGLHPTCSLFLFHSLQVGPTLCRGEGDGVMAISLVGRTQCAQC